MKIPGRGKPCSTLALAGPAVIEIATRDSTVVEEELTTARNAADLRLEAAARDPGLTIKVLASPDAVDDATVPGHWLWNLTSPVFDRDGKHEFGHRIGRGRHTIQLIRAADEDDLECGGIVVTNDFGFLPSDGYTSFLPMQEE